MLAITKRGGNGRERKSTQSQSCCCSAEEAMEKKKVTYRVKARGEVCSKRRGTRQRKKEKRMSRRAAATDLGVEGREGGVKNG